MIKRFIWTISAIAGLSVGISLGPKFWPLMNLTHKWLTNAYVNGLIFALFFIIIGSMTMPLIERFIRRVLLLLEQQTIGSLVINGIGILIGFLCGYLVSLPFRSLQVPVISTTLPFIFPFVFGIIGYLTISNRREEISAFFENAGAFVQRKEKEEEAVIAKAPKSFKQYKVLDTSVIIDGRIADVLKTHFLEGTLVIPNFVLKELQGIADSADSLTRTKGRRGLDILQEIQEDPNTEVEFYEGDFSGVQEVDLKLIKLAQEKEGAIVTNDYNLNKVAGIQNVPVFNINELANAVKPVVVPGEPMHVLIVRKGTERQQGVAYLDDGTMIVVEDGKRHLNDWVDVEVTSALQTSAGRMIFAKLIDSNN